ncbi:MAG: hypothetical protein ETSY1_44470 [Candidatus Entotheonella factor]|uniref:Uncharacterized protein n=1 Tax=Entotheonella factor TaxID=1429438 RepID=W4L4K1_ENTF1|nr:MAG: hypothetical protein ETSY1_44470 [Candidatus Entotheonella factor]
MGMCQEDYEMDASHHHSGQHEAQLTIVMSRQTGLLGQLVAFLGRHTSHLPSNAQRTRGRLITSL